MTTLRTFEEWLNQTMADGYLECPICKADQAWEEAWTGTLGTRLHFKCQACGGEWSMEEGEDVCR